MTEYNIRLNPNCAAAVHTGLKFKAGDKGIEFKIAVDELDTIGTTAKIVFLRANGTSVESDIAGTNGVYTYKTLGNEFAVPGKTVADVKFYAADARVSTASFVFEVSGDTMDGLGAGAGGYSDRLEQLATEAEDAMKNAENVSKELENLLTVYQNKFGEVGVLNPKGTYNNATTYEAFDLVYDGGVSWLCLQRCTGVTPAEGAYWQLFASADGGNAAKLGGKGASEYALDADLANCLSKSGGTIDGDLEIKSTSLVERKLAIQNSIRRITLEVATNGTSYLWDGTNQEPIIENTQDGTNTFNGTANYLSTQNNDEINFKGLTGNDTLWFNCTNGDTGTADTVPLTAYAFCDKTGTSNRIVLKMNQGSGAREIIHTGNKPTGTYTGNGSATERTINVGGIGKVLYITGSGYGVYVDDCGATAHSWEGGEPITLPNSAIRFRDGVLTIATASNVVNLATTYDYQVL